jgi:hypothetical protein
VGFDLAFRILITKNTHPFALVTHHLNSIRWVAAHSVHGPSKYWLPFKRVEDLDKESKGISAK